MPRSFVILGAVAVVAFLAGFVAFGVGTIGH